MTATLWKWFKLQHDWSLDMQMHCHVNYGYVGCVYGKWGLFLLPSSFFLMIRRSSVPRTRGLVGNLEIGDLLRDEWILMGTMMMMMMKMKKKRW